MVIAIENKLPDVALIRAARSGDRVAFGRLYEQYGRLVHGILLAHVAYDQAEDLMQDVFVKAMQQLPALRDPAAFCGWLMTITRRVAADHKRKSNPRDNSTLSLSTQNIPSNATTFDSAPLAVLEIVQRLPETYRETLILRLVEGMTGPEIAARTGLTSDSVRVNLCRGMKLLRGYMKEREE